MEAFERIAFAMDVSTLRDACKFEAMLGPYVGAFKVGLELFISCGGIPRIEKPVILDLKLHDIPETVARAVKAGGDKGAKFMTLHIQQRKALEEAVKAAEPFKMQLLGVTVLTSMEASDLHDLSHADSTVESRVFRLARHAHACGLTGFVCSPQEVKGMRERFPDSFLLVPGIRPAGPVADDQKRVGTPAQAVKDGANLIVVGRPIRDAKSPTEAAKAIADEIETG